MRANEAYALCHKSQKTDLFLFTWVFVQLKKQVKPFRSEVTGQRYSSPSCMLSILVEPCQIPVFFMVSLLLPSSFSLLAASLHFSFHISSLSWADIGTVEASVSDWVFVLKASNIKCLLFFLLTVWMVYKWCDEVKYMTAAQMYNWLKPPIRKHLSMQIHPFSVQHCSTLKHIPDPPEISRTWHTMCTRVFPCAVPSQSKPKTPGLQSELPGYNPIPVSALISLQELGILWAQYGVNNSYSNHWVYQRRDLASNPS